MANQPPDPPGQVFSTRALLTQAGYREYRHFLLYVGMHVLIALLGMEAVLLVFGLGSPLLLFAVPATGFLLIRLLLKRFIRNRQKRIRLGLTDTLDLTALCIEAGLFPSRP
jgi:pilus assembly protein TadC